MIRSKEVKRNNYGSHTYVIYKILDIGKIQLANGYIPIQSTTSFSVELLNTEMYFGNFDTPDQAEQYIKGFINGMQHKDIL